MGVHYTDRGGIKPNQRSVLREEQDEEKDKGRNAEKDEEDGRRTGHPQTAEEKIPRGAGRGYYRPDTPPAAGKKG